MEPANIPRPQTKWLQKEKKDSSSENVKNASAIAQLMNLSEDDCESHAILDSLD